MKLKSKKVAAGVYEVKVNDGSYFLESESDEYGTEWHVTFETNNTSVAGCSAYFDTKKEALAWLPSAILTNNQELV